MNKVVRVTGFEQEQSNPFMNVSFEVVTPVGTFQENIDIIKPTTFENIEDRILGQLIEFFTNLKENITK